MWEEAASPLPTSRLTHPMSWSKLTLGDPSTEAAAFPLKEGAMFKC